MEKKADEKTPEIGEKAEGDAKDATDAEPSIGSNVVDFVTGIDSLVETVPVTVLVHSLMHVVVSTQFSEFMKTKGGVDKSNYLTVSRSMKKVKRASNALPIITTSVLVSLTSQYDAFLGALLRTLFCLKPECFDLSKKQLTYEEVVAFGSMESVREYIIEKEVETVLRKSHAEQFEWLESRFELPLRKNLAVWPQFIELTERRNLFVHANGIVSQQYLDVCKKHGVVHKQPVVRGAALECDLDYIMDAHACIMEIGVKLAHTLWRKLLPDDREAADANLNAVCYDLLVEKRFSLACKLLEFAVEQKKHHSDYQAKLFTINYAQAHKWSGDAATACKIIGETDWSAASAVFRLAEKVLLDKYSAAAAIMKEMGATGQVEQHEYEQWPVFTAFRESEDFRGAFAEIFGQPYKVPEPVGTEQVKTAVEQWQRQLAETVAARQKKPLESPKTKEEVGAG